MGKRGRQPAPTALKLVQGVANARINTDEPVPREGMPQCPEQASRDVKAVWDFTLEQLDYMHLLREADRDTLYAYCVAVVAHRAATLQLEAEGFTIIGATGTIVKHPASQIQRETAAQIRQFAQEFGLTPSARSAIKVSGLESRRDTGAARLLSS